MSLLQFIEKRLAWRRKFSSNHEHIQPSVLKEGVYRLKSELMADGRRAVSIDFGQTDLGWSAVEIVIEKESGETWGVLVSRATDKLIHILQRRRSNEDHSFEPIYYDLAGNKLKVENE